MWGESDLSPTPYIQTTLYNPTKQHPMAALVSVLPIVLLFVLMLGFKMAGHRSAFVSLLAQATQHDLETIVICKAAFDIYDGLEAKNECASIATQEACLYMLEMFTQVCGVDIKSRVAAIVH